MKPYYYLLERGDDPVSAYRKTYDQIMRNIEFRTWYRNRPLGSDYEDEVILAGLNADDNDNPYDVLLRNGRHEAKLKEWKTMRPEEKWVRVGGGGGSRSGWLTYWWRGGAEISPPPRFKTWVSWTEPTVPPIQIFKRGGSRSKACLCLTGSLGQTGI